MAIYDAFISYSHARDKPLAAALQSLLETLGKPWYRRRSLRVFRDDACLAAQPLWPAIESALSHSRYLLLLASPQAAESQWVAREVEYWLANKSVDTVLIAVTSGRLEWDDAKHDFVWGPFTPLPATLRGRFGSEPKWVELHGLRHRSPRLSRRFGDMGATLAAAIHGVSKDALLAREVWQQRRALMLATAVAGALLVLGLTTAWYWREAVEANEVAIQQRNAIEAQSQAAERTYIAAARAANSLILGMAREFAQRGDVPKDLVQNLLYRAQFLQDQLAETAAYAPDLMRGNIAVLGEVALAFARYGDFESAIAVAERGLTLAIRLAGEPPQDAENARLVAASHESVGEVLLKADRRAEARAQFEKAVAQREKLLKADPDNKELQEELAAAQRKLAASQ